MVPGFSHTSSTRHFSFYTTLVPTRSRNPEFRIKVCHRQPFFVERKALDAGSTQEFTDKLLRYRVALLAYIRTITRDHHLAEDAFQETAIALAKEWDDGVEIRNFWGFAKETARRRALAALRSASNLQLLGEEAMDNLDAAFEEISEQSESRKLALRNCLLKLPFAWREVIEMRYWEDQAVKDIAAIRGRTESAVSVTLNRARGRLMDCISQAIRSTPTQ
jgi:RNA polymerase sigma-70 factor (ECF subfamily)